MITFIEHKNINKQKWDDCIEKSTNASVFVYSWYLDVVFPGWSALVLNDYDAVFVLTIKSKFAIQYFFHPTFVKHLEIYSASAVSKETELEFWKAIPKSVKLVDIHYGLSFPLVNENYIVEKRIYQSVDLNKPYLQIQSEYGSSILKNLKKSVKAKLSIITSVPNKNIITFYKNNVGGKIPEFKDVEYHLMEKLMDKAIEKNHAFTIGVMDEQNTIVASAFILISKNELYFFKGSASNYGKIIGAMHFLLDAIFKQYAQKDVSFNFAGSSIEGIANFNRSFGGKDFLYLHVVKNNLPKLLNWLRLLKKYKLFI